MTKTRILSAAVAAFIVIVVIYFGGYTGIGITTFFVSFLALREYGRMAFDGPRYANTRKYFISLGLMAFSISIFKNDLILHSFVLSTLLIFVLFLQMARDATLPLHELVNKAGLSLLGILYAGVCPVYLCLLSTLSSHLEWLIFTLAIVFSGDIAAYFIGLRFGKTRLFQRISPKKSVEGAIGSLFASVGVGLLLRVFIFPEIDLFLILMLCILTSIIAQLGDLSESMIKRSFNTKDSGTLLPGHGGLLDRMDGVFFAAPFVYVYAKYVVQI